MKNANGVKIKEVESGEWISDPNFPGWKCSICGAHIVLDVSRWGQFCPHCGHPMTLNYKGIKLK